MRGGQLSNNFGYQASGAAVQLAATPSVSLFSTISNRSTSFSVDLTQNINASGAGAIGLAQTAKAGLAGAKQDIAGLKAGMVADIKSAQAEILAATKVAGYEPRNVFPDIAPSNDADFAMTAISAAGKGSFVTALANSMEVASVVEEIKSDRAQTPEQAMSQIADVLRAASQPSQQQQQFGHIVQADETPEMQDTSIDWEAVLEEYPEALVDIMAFDENSYNPALWPEMAAVDQALAGIELKMGELNTVQIHSAAIDAADMNSLTAQAALIDATSMDTSMMAMSAGLETPQSQNFDREAEFQAYLNEQKVTHAVPMGRVS